MRGAKVLTAVLVVTLTMGCASLSRNKKVPKEVNKKVNVVQRLANNIPLYPKFKYQPDKSFFFESNGVKAGVMVFQGRAKVGDMVNFYKQEMPGYGWTLVSAYQYGNQALLDFTTPDKTCQISVEEKPFNTLLTIRTGTKEPEAYTK